LGLADRSYGSAYKAPGRRTRTERVEQAEDRGVDAATFGGVTYELGACQFGGGVVAHWVRFVALTRRHPGFRGAVLRRGPEVDQVRRRARRQYRNQFSDYPHVEALHIFAGAPGGADAVHHGHGPQSFEEVTERSLWLLDDVEAGPSARRGEPTLARAYAIKENPVAHFAVVRN
jgi:hypothetical protein